MFNLRMVIQNQNFKGAKRKKNKINISLNNRQKRSSKKKQLFNKKKEFLRFFFY